MAGYPYHHDTSMCTMVHSPTKEQGEDYCMVCHDTYWCAGVTHYMAEKIPDWEGALASCPYPVADKTEREARDDSLLAKDNHMRWGPQKVDCWPTVEHYQVPDSFLTGEFWHDTAVMYDRCTVCGSTYECNEVRDRRTCSYKKVDA